MSTDCFQMAAEGWRIITRFEEPRQSARHLLRWLAETLDLSAAEMSYKSVNGAYGWQETVGRFVPTEKPVQRWVRPFPTGDSQWILEGDAPMLASFEVLLDLLADQWLRVAAEGTRAASERRSPEHRYPGWTALSPASRIIRSRIAILSRTLHPLLIIGENGSGRRHLAGIIHDNGPDPAAPLSGPEENSEEGTLYIPDWSAEDTAAETEPDTRRRRLIAAVTPEKCTPEVRRKWRDRYGENAMTLTVPPLRERREDIPALAGIFMEESTAAGTSRPPELSLEATELLRRYSWPGNAGELRDAMERTLDKVDIGINRITADLLPPEIRGAADTAGGITFPEKITALEYEVLRKELSRQRGNMTRTARALGLTPRQVSWRVRKYGIDPRDFKPHLA